MSNEWWLKDNIFLSLPSSCWSSPGCSCLCFRFSVLCIRTPSFFLQNFSSARRHTTAAQCISLQRTIPFKEQDFAYVLVEFDKVPVCPFCEGPPVRQLCSQAHWLVPSLSHHLQIWWVLSVAVGSDVKQEKSQDRPVHYCTCHWPPATAPPINHSPLCPVFQTTVLQIHYPLIHTAISWLEFKNIIEDSVKNLAKVEINGTYYSPLVHKSIHFIIKGKLLGRHDLSLENLYWLLPITFVSLKCSEACSKIYRVFMKVTSPSSRDGSKADPCVVA